MSETTRKPPLTPFRQRVAEDLIDRLRQGTAPWQTPLKPGIVRARPHNPVSGAAYRGGNRLWLRMQGRADPRWMTYNQAGDIDAQVRKGEKGTVVEYWRWSEERIVRDGEGKPILGEDGAPVTARQRLDRPQVFRTIVFNGEQIDGLDPYRAPEPAFDPIDRAERALRDTTVPILHDQDQRMVYQPADDTIHLPPKAAFKDAAHYYATALHEAAHATGHPARLDRDLYGPFGCAAYAREELRAEIASMMLGGTLAIGFDPGNHAAYVNSWIEALRNDPNEIFRAAGDAEVIHAWIVEPDKRRALEHAAHARRQARQQETAIIPRRWTQGAAMDSAPRRDREQGVPTQPVAAQRDAGRQEEKAMTATAPDAQRTGRLYLAVPYADKEQAKAAGARWDRRAKAWYAPPTADRSAFAPWRRREGTVPPPAQADPAAAFADACREHGLRLAGPPTMDGRWHRVPVEDDRRGQKSGAYKGFLDGHPAGLITNYKSGQQAVKWVAHAAQPDRREIGRAKAQAQARRAHQAAQLKAQYRQVAKRAYGLFHNAAPAASDHPYLAAKQVPPGGLRVDGNGALLMPLTNERGYLDNLQAIAADGGKRFLKGGKKRGLFHRLDGDARGPILIAEGYATAASLNMATGLTVVAALDAGNLTPVAEALRRRDPHRTLIIAADDDHANQHNAGLDGARRAAAAAGAEIITPDLTAAEKKQRLSDFNDLHRARGLDALTRSLKAQLHPLLTHSPGAAQAVTRDRSQKRRQAPVRQRALDDMHRIEHLLSPG